jgi:hypothetical protein
MKLTLSFSALYLLASSFGFSLTAQAASITQLTSASQLSSSDILFVDSDPVGTIYNTSSFAANSELTFSRSSGSYELDQVDVNYGNTAFTSGTKIIGAGGFQGPGSGGPITITFSTPVSEFGLDIEDYYQGPYVVDFQMVDVTGVTSELYMASGDDPLRLSFEGLTSTIPIKSVTFDDSKLGGSNDLLFGNIMFAPDTSVGSGAPPSVPEPSTLPLFGLGFFALGAIRRRFSLRR